MFRWRKERIKCKRAFEKTTSANEYVDTFTNNEKNYIVRKDGWIDLTDDEENKNIFRILFKKSRSATNLSKNGLKLIMMCIDLKRALQIAPCKS